MNKKLLLSIVVLLLPVLACSFGGVVPRQVVGSGKAATETRALSGFTGVELKGAANVDITFGETESVVVQADDNILPLIQTTVENSRLVISTKPGANLSTHNPVRVTVTMKSLQSLTLSGSGNINVADLAAKDLQVDLPGSGNITVSGTADRVDLRLPGSGNLFCSGLKASAATVSVSGSGQVTVYASESLDVSLSGSGAIRYEGNPAQVSKSVTGSGSITP
jgi:hypothetical protein